MSEINDGGAAFPDPGRAQSAKQRAQLTDTGMTLRDYFAAKALQGMMANSIYMGSVTKVAADRDIPRDEGVAIVCYEMADALLAERAK